MLIRRKILLASLIGGGLMPLRELAAQVKFAPDHDGDDEWHRPQRRRPGRTFDEDLDERIEDPPDPRPTMPPPRLELRPPPPDRDEWHWRSGHWVRIGEGWRWVHGGGITDTGSAMPTLIGLTPRFWAATAGRLSGGVAEDPALAWATGGATSEG